MQTTPSGEVAVFIDDNQFGAGQSTMKCGPEALSLFWHSVQVGQKNPYTSVDVHTMAHDDYVQFIGPDTADDGNGTSDETLYKMLQFHKFHYCGIDLDWSVVKAFIGWGFPVIVGIEEASVVDRMLGGNPYNWDTSGRTHIVLATGLSRPGEIYVRDTANIDLSGIVRPGPRAYLVPQLDLVSATVVVPTWMENPFQV